MAVTMPESDEPPPDPLPFRAAGRHLPWTSAPPELRLRIEEEAGSSVVAAQDQQGGFSPGVAASLTLADGNRIFVKAVHPTGHSDSPDIHRREAEIMARMPADAPVPRMLWSFDEGPEGWVALA